MTNDRGLTILKRLNKINAEIYPAKLIAVSKYSTITDILWAIKASQLEFGENKVNDLKNKSEAIYEQGHTNVRWHFIGHLQTNKVKELLKVKNLTAIHSIDSVRLLNEILKHSKNLESSIDIFLQVNTSNEDEKSGFHHLDELKESIKLIEGDSKLNFVGLMTMSKVRTDNYEVDAKNCFLKLVGFRDALEKDLGLKNLKLSMGMSDDYKIAVDLGSHFVRIGSKIFNSSEDLN